MIQALNTAQVDKVDLMHFQVLDNGEIVYEKDIGPPPPLFEDPSVIRVRFGTKYSVKSKQFKQAEKFKSFKMKVES